MLNKEDREFLRKQIFYLLVLKEKISKSEIVKRFKKIGVSRSTIYSMIRKIERDDSYLDKQRPGRPSSWTKKKIKN